MGKIKELVLSMPLRKAFVTLVLMMAAMAAIASAAVISLCFWTQQKLLDSVTVIEREQFAEEEEGLHFVIADGEQIRPGENGGLIILSREYKLEQLSAGRRSLYYAAKAAVLVVPFALVIGGSLLCAWLFYKWKLESPIRLLKRSAEKIGQNELDFELDYISGDELGEVCMVMNTMRSALRKNNEEIWELMEERRKLNASIAHDLRTPVTVVKGYTEYLMTNIPLGKINEDRLMKTLKQLETAAVRLERYTDSVREMQTLDTLPVKRERSSLRSLFTEIDSEFSVLADQHGISFYLELNGTEDAIVMLDRVLTRRILDNLAGNAIRYAEEKIRASANWENGWLSFRIEDDGKGFSKEALLLAKQPYFKENSENDHFGLGLFICDTLCRKLGGSLTISNSVSGGACAAVSISAEKAEVYGLVDQ